MGAPQRRETSTNTAADRTDAVLEVWEALYGLALLDAVPRMQAEDLAEMQHDVSAYLRDARSRDLGEMVADLHDCLMVPVRRCSNEYLVSVITVTDDELRTLIRQCVQHLDLVQLTVELAQLPQHLRNGNPQACRTRIRGIALLLSEAAHAA